MVRQVQLCLWNYDDPCNTFPTLRFDVAVDSFFLARAHAHAHARARKRARRRLMARLRGRKGGKAGARERQTEADIMT